MNAPFKPPLLSQQRDRASMEALAGLIKFSSGVLRENARETFRARPEGRKSSG